MEKLQGGQKWGESRATAAAVRACEMYSLEKPELIRISHAAVYSSGVYIVRVEQQGRPVWSGTSLVALTRHVASEGIRTAPPVFELLPLIVDDLHVTFYKRVIEQTHMPETKKAFLLGEQLARLHDEVSPERVELLNMDGIDLDFSSATFNRTLRSLEKIKELGSSSLSMDDVDFMISNLHEMRSKLLGGILDNASAAVSIGGGSCDGTGSDREGRQKVVIHGDSHLGNVLSVDDGIILLDFEHTAIAEPFFDHVHLLISDLVFKDSNIYPAFAEGYGEDFSGLPEIMDWVKVISVSYLTWTASMGEHYPEYRKEAKRRMAWWCGDADAPEFWTPGF